jgi:hypothetical protein
VVESAFVRVGLVIASLAAVGLVAGCGDGEKASPTTTTSTTRSVSHAAPDLEALLPAGANGKALRKGSTTGAVVFGGNAFGRVMTRFLAKHGKRPNDLRFANAQTSSHNFQIELGVFQVRGLPGSALRQAIVESSRPAAPGLKTSSATLSGKRVTKVMYSGGSTLYLYAHDDLVFYVGTQNEALAGSILAMFP